MKITRRRLLGAVATGTVAALAPRDALAEKHSAAPPQNAAALLYDASLCVGCQACVSACASANNLTQDASLDVQRAADRGLSSRSKSAIELYRAPDGGETSFVKRQCMQCVDPACVASCMFHALYKDPKTGIVHWKSNRCVGCRYCEVVCPFDVPRFEWTGFNPRVVKCELCSPRLAAGQEPACSTVCPTHAVIYGQRASLLEIAHKRIAASPSRYFENRVYGERDGGGTQALYLSHVAFDKLGLPRLGNESIPAKFLKWQKRIYSYLVAPTAVYALLVGVLAKRCHSHKLHETEEEITTGLRPQL